MTQGYKKDTTKVLAKYQTLTKYSMYCFMFKTIIKVIGHHACFQATEGGKNYKYLMDYTEKKHHNVNRRKTKL